MLDGAIKFTVRPGYPYRSAVEWRMDKSVQPADYEYRQLNRSGAYVLTTGDT